MTWSLASVFLGYLLQIVSFFIQKKQADDATMKAFQDFVANLQRQQLITVSVADKFKSLDEKLDGEFKK